MNELALVERIRKMADPSGNSGRARGVTLGIGHDCAIFQPPGGFELLLKTDQLIERVHFTPRTPAPLVGERALARALSDIAAMGGEPRACLVSLALPKSKSGEWAIDFFKGLLRLARRTKTALAGGDLSRDDHVHCAVMLVGIVKKGKALRRDGARPGDGLYVSGRLGKPWDRPIRPRLELGQSLAGRATSGRATSCMDVSDGLALDLHRLCLESKVAAEVDRVPVFAGATLDRALHGGDDYELLFTLPASQKAPRGVTRIGQIVAGSPGEIRFQGRKLIPRGWKHFAR
jgi:thiamine-monophosphate kinase